MRKLALILLVLGLACPVLGQDATETYTDTIPAGTTAYTWTNALEFGETEGVKQLWSCAFQMSATVTNTFSIDHLRDKWELTVSDNVTTNIFGTVETNTYVSARSVVTVTNRILGPVTATNQTSNVYDTYHPDTNERRLPRHYNIAYDDRLVFNFSYTNEIIRLIRNMK